MLDKCFGRAPLTSSTAC